MIQLPTTQLHLQNTFITKYIDTNIHLNNTATASYDYASTQKSITFTKDSMPQIIVVLIYDKGGFDRFVFGSAIKREDVVVKLLRNRDLVIGLKEDGVAFEDLKDTVTMVDWMKPANRINVIEFGDGGTLAFTANRSELFGKFTQLADENSVINNRDFKVDEEVA